MRDDEDDDSACRFIGGDSRRRRRLCSSSRWGDGPLPPLPPIGTVAPSRSTISLGTGPGQMCSMQQPERISIRSCLAPPSVPIGRRSATKGGCSASIARSTEMTTAQIPWSWLVVQVIEHSTSPMSRQGMPADASPLWTSPPQTVKLAGICRVYPLLPHTCIRACAAQGCTLLRPRRDPP